MEIHSTSRAGLFFTAINLTLHLLLYYFNTLIKSVLCTNRISWGGETFFRSKFWPLFCCSRCRSGIAGRRCDHCAPGSYGFPHCKPCKCNRGGTEPDICNPQTGVCLCKVRCFDISKFV